MTIATEYKNNLEVITEVATNKELNNAIRLTDYKRYLITLTNAYEDVNAGLSILAGEGDITNAVNALMESGLIPAKQERKFTVTFNHANGMVNTRYVMATSEEHAIKMVDASYNHTGIVKIEEEGKEVKTRVEMGQFELGQVVEVTMMSGNQYKGYVTDFTSKQTLLWLNVGGVLETINMHHVVVAMLITEEVEVKEAPYHMGQLLFVECPNGDYFSGRIVDIGLDTNIIWVNRTTTDEWVLVNVAKSRITVLAEPKEEISEELANEVKEAIPAPLDVKNITEIKGEYKEELAEQWEDVDYHTVMVYNSEDDNGTDIFDCEFTAYDTTGDYMFTVYFGTYYDEKEALKAARAMRTKLAKYYDIEGQVSVYTC
ncbi:hypothetical protein BI001_gp001 [Bacillus phage Zuko]|nr:hypothetical protein BI001_gp001 [Bacillus phage Zuko]AMW62604.1 hypothetical protein ZUKO_1 [Bacillus phage Zuko]